MALRQAMALTQIGAWTDFRNSMHACTLWAKSDSCFSSAECAARLRQLASLPLIRRQVRRTGSAPPSIGERALPDVTIALLTGGDIQMETVVNELGELHLNGKSDLGSKLRIKSLRVKVVSIPLE